MANEFGNAGAISQSTVRIDSKKLEVSFSSGAEYEAFYGGYWRDISSDFFYDTTKAGNTIARCIRWDDGFRSYRVDRGLIIRKKETPEDSTSPDDDDLITGGDIFASFAKSAGVAFGLSLGVEAFNKRIQPKLAKTVLGNLLTKQPTSAFGKFLNDNKITLALTAYNLFKETDQSTAEKLGQAATSIAVGYGVRKVAGPYAFLVGPAIGLVKDLFEGQSIKTAGPSTLGKIIGRQVGVSVGNSLFTQIPVAVPPTSIQQGALFNLLNEGAAEQTYTTHSYQYPSNTSETLPNKNTLTRVSAIVNEAYREQESRQENINAANSAKREKSLRKLAASINRQTNRKGRIF